MIFILCTFYSFVHWHTYALVSTILVFLLLVIIFPLIIAGVMCFLTPLDWYLKKRIITQATKKLQKYPSIQVIAIT